MTAAIRHVTRRARSGARQIEWLAGEAATLGRTGLRVVAGRSELHPDARDRRFQDPAWETNAVYRRIAQTYLAVSQSVERVVEHLEDEATDSRTTQQTRFLAQILMSALAPTNTVLGNPEAVKEAFDTGGASLVRGARNMARDLLHNGGMPSQADPSAFTVGEDLAVTPGEVVHRHDIAELLHYRPTTPEVATRPVLIIPPPIGRHYFLDLRPGRSFVEYAVERGLDTYLLTWRSATREHADWDLDAYAREILHQIEVVREISGSEQINTIGFCAGGILQTGVLNRLAAMGEQPVHSAAYAVTLLDFGQSAPIGAFSSPRLLRFTRWLTRRRGVMPANDMGSIFSWMRPDDLVFNYLVNDWLLGKPPPAFDILSWNADGTNLPATLHEQFLDIFEKNPLVQPGGLHILDTPLNLSTITLPSFVAGGNTDHLTPWRACYRTTQLLGSEDTTFALSNAGHIASLVNPPGNPRSRYQVGPANLDDPDQWLQGAETCSGSWWEAWADWTLERGGDPRPVPERLDSDAHPTLGEAPGLYVHDLTP